MPDLSADSVALWLRRNEPDVAVELASSVPSGEEHEDVLPALLRLGNAMDAAAAADKREFCECLARTGNLPNVQRMLAALGQGRRLFLFHWISEISESSGLPNTLLCEGNVEAAAFLRAEFKALHRRALLERIFSSERIKTLLAACSEVP